VDRGGEIVAVLRDIEERVRLDFFPIIGPVKGELLYALTLLTRPKLVLELGTGIGYSGLQIARGLECGGRIITVDQDAERVAEARSNFRRAGVDEVFSLVVRDAVDFLSGDKNNYDMIFVDIDKSKYMEVIDPCVARLRGGGVLVFDNALRPGLEGFRRAIMRHPMLRSSIIQLEDGVSISVKKLKE